MSGIAAFKPRQPVWHVAGWFALADPPEVRLAKARWPRGRGRFPLLQ